MDESYHKFARAVVHLGKALDEVCVSVGPRLQHDPRLDFVRNSAHEFLRFGVAIEKEEPQVLALVGRFAQPEMASRLESTASIVTILGQDVAQAQRECRGLPMAIVEDAGIALYEIEPFIAEVLPGDPVIHGKPRPRPRRGEQPASPVSPEPASPRPGGGAGGGTRETSLNQVFTSLLKDFDRAI